MSESPREAMLRHLRWQADACAELGSPFYAVLLARVADDVDAGGPSRDVLAGHETDPGPSALALRLMGGVHRLVLEGRVPELALTFPSVGGTGDAAAAWPALRDVLAEHRDELRQLLHQAPQTNEVGRAAALVGGLLHLAAEDPRPVRLVELGASGGLNLRADRFRIDVGGGRSVGPPASPVLLDRPWQGVVPPLRPAVEVVARLGCDPAPVDPTTSDGRLLLTSYVWPDQHDRLARLRGAFEVATQLPATVEQSGAADFLDRLELVAGTTTVVWHSVMWQYVTPGEQARVTARLAELGAGAGRRAGLARLSFEPRLRTPGAEYEVVVALQTWPAGEERVLGVASPHGIPTTWE